jgi:hypothetical protein
MKGATEKILTVWGFDTAQDPIIHAKKEPKILIWSSVPFDTRMMLIIEFRVGFFKNEIVFQWKTSGLTTWYFERYCLENVLVMHHFSPPENCFVSVVFRKIWPLEK